FIDGAPVATPTTVGFGTVLEAGNSLVRLGPPAGRAPERSCEAGVVRFNRPPRVTPGPEERTFAAPAPPTAPEKGRIPLVGALAPLVLAVPLLAIGVGGGGGSMVAIGVATALLSALIAVGS